MTQHRRNPFNIVRTIAVKLTIGGDFAARDDAKFRCSGFEESGRACLALGLGSGGADCLGVLARGAVGVGGARVGLGAAARLDIFEESGRACLALGLSGGGAGYLGVRARGAVVAVGDARTTCRQMCLVIVSVGFGCS